MKKLILLMAGLAFLFRIAMPQNNYPVVGVSDERIEVYGLKNASVYVDYANVLRNTDILIVKGRIAAVGSGLDFPAGTIVRDMSGKTIYPSFIDICSAYGVAQEQRAQGTNPYAAMMGGGRGGAQAEEKPVVADYWNQNIHESYDAVSEFKPDAGAAEKLRKAGFGAVASLKQNGLARGTAVLVNLGDDKANKSVLIDKVSSNYSFDRGISEEMYPLAQYGSIALLRQFNYDAQWYSKLPGGYFFDAGLEAVLKNKNLPKIFEVNDKYEILRADKIAREFGYKYIVKGGGNEYQLLDEIKKTGISLVLPLDFPAAPDVKDPYSAAAVPLSTLKHWEMAPANPFMVNEKGIEFAFTASGLSNQDDFMKNIRKSIKYGLPEEAALKALTFTPAKLLSADKMLGSLKKGMIANLLVTSGNIFDEKTVLYENWVDGKPYMISDMNLPDLSGSYKLELGDSVYNIVISGTAEKHTVKVSSGDKDLKSTIEVKNRLLNISITTRGGVIRLSGIADPESLEGDVVLAGGEWGRWKADRVSEEESGREREGEKGRMRPGQKKEVEEKPSFGKVIYPFVAYGWEEKPVQEDVLFKNATVWTNEDEGILQESDVLVKDGKIAKVGKNLNAGKARVINATGMHLTPGIMDEHSHIAMSSTNETGQAITSEVRVADIIDASDLSIYRQLSGGVTAAHILHGSANPIGGQSVLIKHRWGSSPEEMKIDGQVGFLKHALGENVKRTTTRFPNTRMGVEHIIRDAYQRALEYNREWEEYSALGEKEKAGKIPPRRDLELDAIVDVLKKRSFISCHTYVQSEANMIMTLAEDFGIKAHTLIHFNEGYKMADRMKEHGAAGSVFSDWWFYKYEVYEGIQYNAATLLQQGVLTCLHSDNAELARRLNQEAGKIVKYGGIEQEEALKLVTLNTAKILHLDNRMGSIKVGKDADLALWTDNPLSVYARANKTMVDGIIYFDEEKDAMLKLKIDEERNRIIQKILNESPAAASAMMPARMRRGANN
ncbi:MAG: amidohydrolase family protein [Marinilabiliaceae bacterium]|jgi:imidazolonepropionase-like amidohydrolase|nr:amidohydrolase family protein [Marinilabiliaceae bacterium]